MNQKTFITTTLPYVNSKPHIGHALEFILADILKRYLNVVLGKDVVLNIGLDEHGLKVFIKAQELEKTPQEYCDEQSLNWFEFCKQFKINYDIFYRTTSPEHTKKVHKFWNECLERGDLYKKEYSGKYCIGCESFKTDADLINGKCPDHNTEPVFTSEENWFFRTSKYADTLLEWLDGEGKKFLIPQNKINELRNIVENSKTEKVIIDGVETEVNKDLSVSRKKESVPWGVPVPNDDTQVIYVWYEALLNYIFAANYDSKENNYWEDTTIQLCGPDNLRFQGHIFQALLASAGIKQTTKLLVHGTILDANGKKMSKTLGNVVDPIEQLEKYGLDAVRYYTAAGLNTFLNANWNERELVDLYNSALADDLGNLLARTLHLVDTKSCAINIELSEKSFRDIVDEKFKEVAVEWENLNINKALELTNSIVKFGNKYINDVKPWNNEYVIPLNNLYYLFEQCTLYLSPVIPDACERIKESLKNKKKVIIFPKLSLGLETVK